MSGYYKFFAFLFLVFAFIDRGRYHDMPEAMYDLAVAVFFMLVALHDQRSASPGETRDGL